MPPGSTGGICPNIGDIDADGRWGAARSELMGRACSAPAKGLDGAAGVPGGDEDRGRNSGGQCTLIKGGSSLSVQVGGTRPEASSRTERDPQYGIKSKYMDKCQALSSGGRDKESSDGFPRKGDSWQSGAVNVLVSCGGESMCCVKGEVVACCNKELTSSCSDLNSPLESIERPSGNLGEMPYAGIEATDKDPEPMAESTFKLEATKHCKSIEFSDWQQHPQGTESLDQANCIGKDRLIRVVSVSDEQLVSSGAKKDSYSISKLECTRKTRDILVHVTVTYTLAV